MMSGLLLAIRSPVVAVRRQAWVAALAVVVRAGDGWGGDYGGEARGDGGGGVGATIIVVVVLLQRRGPSPLPPDDDDDDVEYDVVLILREEARMGDAFMVMGRPFRVIRPWRSGRSDQISQTREQKRTFN